MMSGELTLFFLPQAPPYHLFISSLRRLMRSSSGGWVLNNRLKNPGLSGFTIKILARRQCTSRIGQVLTLATHRHLHNGRHDGRKDNSHNAKHQQYRIGLAVIIVTEP